MVTKNGDKYLRISLKTIYERVKEYNFGMPHKAFLVNFYYVKGIKNNEIVLENQKSSKELFFLFYNSIIMV